MLLILLKVCLKVNIANINKEGEFKDIHIVQLFFLECEYLVQIWHRGFVISHTTNKKGLLLTEE